MIGVRFVGILGMALLAGASAVSCARTSTRVEPSGVPDAIPTTDADAKRLAARFGVEVVDADEQFPSSKLFIPREPGPHPAIILLHGSGPEGGALTWFPAAQLAQRGFLALAFSYCGAPGTPPLLVRVDLSRTVRAAYWLASHERVSPHRVALLGWSRGAEHALLVATETEAPIAAVAAYAPTDIVYAGWDPVREQVVREHGVAAPAWIVRGNPLQPFTPIRIESFKGSLLLVAGDMDEIWPSAEAARVLGVQMESAGRSAQVHVFPREGHFLSWDASSIAMEETIAIFHRALR